MTPSTDPLNPSGAEQSGASLPAYPSYPSTLTPQDPHSPVPAVRMHGLTKDFGGHIAVKNLTLDIPRGSFYGIVGPNGAGKTTAITMATGLLEPTAEIGRAHV